jgi:hypothetical protein
MLLCADTRDYVGTLLSDQAKITTGRVVLCLLCNACREKENDKKIGLNCLVLHSLHFAREEYIRVGVVAIEKSDWFGPIEGYRNLDRNTKLDRSFERKVKVF